MPTEKAKYRVGVIGVGRQGSYHARAYDLHPLCEVVAGVNTGQETLDLFTERFGVPGYNDYQEMLRREEIDIAVTALPVKPNPDAVIACAEAGVKAVASDKPLAASLADLDRMVEACRSRRIPFAAGTVHRNFKQYWAARKLIDDGELGEVRSVHLYEMTVQGGCNGLTLLRMFAPGQKIRGYAGGDAEVEWVVGSANGDPFSDYDEGLDGLGGYISFTNGIEGVVHPKSQARRGIEVVCTGGVFAGDGRSFQVWKRDDGYEPRSVSDLVEVEGLIPGTSTGEQRSYDDEGWMMPEDRIFAHVESVVDALELGIEPRCNGEDQLAAMEIAFAMRESHRRNHEPVRLPFEDRTQMMFPVPYRWNSKRSLYGDAWYREEMKQHKQSV